MTRSSWSHLAKSAYRSLVQRFAQRSRPARLRRRYDCCGTICIAAEVCEPRQMLSGPTAADDSYTDVHGHTLTVSSMTGVLANDSSGGMGGMGGSLTAVL